jgi:SAM-dependent methyltransferase
MSSLPELDPIVSRLIKGSTILDIGCGKGKWGYFTKVKNPKAYLVGIDIEHEHLSFCKRHRLYDDLILADATHPPFRPGTFDCVIVAEVIEHLPKDKGKVLLDQVEMISRDIVIVTTPAPRAVFSMSKSHVSSWNPKELKERGYSVIGVRALPQFYVSGRVKKFIIALLMGLSMYFPKLSSDMVAIKLSRVKADS